ncbi:MAG: hypothetical protein HQK62_07170, partial [Desulfamplus sp.]|nr:hypothetical protein [Desulfamplus sp.]
MIMHMTFWNLPYQKCYEGIKVKYRRGESGSGTTTACTSSNPVDIWSGQCVEKDLYGEVNAFRIYLSNFEPSKEPAWIYFDIDVPYDTCPFTELTVSSSYQFGSKENLEKYYKPWYDTAKWQADGNPPEDPYVPPVVTTPTLSLTSSADTTGQIAEGESITYTLALTAGIIPAEGINVGYTLSGTAILGEGEDYTCDQINSSVGNCPGIDPTTGAVQGVMFIPYGANSVSFLTLKTNDDTILEADESVSIELAPGSGQYNLSSASKKEITIIDDDQSANLLNIVSGDILFVSIDEPYPIYPGGKITIDDSNTVEGSIPETGVEIVYYLVRDSYKESTIEEIKNNGLLIGTRVVKSDSLDVVGFALEIPDSDSNDNNLKKVFGYGKNQIYSIVKIIDPDNKVSETSESDNLKSVDGLIFNLPDLYIENVNILQSDKGSFEAIATIGNLGDVAANNKNKNLRVSFYAVSGDADPKLVLQGDSTVNIKPIGYSIFNGENVSPDSEGGTKATAIISIDNSICSECFGNSNATFRILVKVNESLLIPESNLFNNF